MIENRARVSLEVGLWDERSERIWWFLAMGSSNYPNYALTFSPKTGLWDGVHTLGAAAATSFVLRDTTQLLLTDPTRGMLAWANISEDDSGQRIVGVLESTMYGLAEDTVRIRPQRMVLTYTSDATEVPGTGDSILWIMSGLLANEFSASADTVVKPAVVGPYAFYTATDRFPSANAGWATYWRWRLEPRSDTLNTLRRFQPLRMSVQFSAGAPGD